MIILQVCLYELEELAWLLREDFGKKERSSPPTHQARPHSLLGAWVWGPGTPHPDTPLNWHLPG